MLTSPFRPFRARRALLTLVVGLAAVAGPLTGCGEIGEKATGARVLVTTDNGTNEVLDREGVEITDGESALTVLRKVAKVTTDAGGANVTTIDGKQARGASAWAFWVNGVPLRSGTLQTRQDINLQQPPVVETPRTAKIHEGDTLWFDLRPRADVGTPRGVVGTFPEPFLHGTGGKRWPVRVECAIPRSRPCRMVRDALVRYQIPAVSSLLRSSYNPGSSRIAVGTWTQLREDPAAVLLERGVGASGVYAKPQPDGRRIALLDDAGRTVRTLGAGTGLIFASVYRDEPPSWVVTGTDQAGLLEAAGAWDEDVLQRRLAVAVHGGTVTALPVASSR